MVTADNGTSPSDGRRLTAVTFDASVSIMSGLAAGTAAGVRMVDGVVELSLASPIVWGAAVGAALALSFVNHVCLTLVARASLGKLVAGLRVVRESDMERPGFFQLIRRWLYGFGWMVFSVPIHLATDSDVSQQDAVGVRIVRRAVSSCTSAG